MSQATTWGSKVTGPATQAQIGAQDNESFNALLSQHSGSSRPAYAVGGTHWIKVISGTSWEEYLYDGTQDILLRSINPTTGVSITADGAKKDLSNLGTVSDAVKIDLAPSGSVIQTASLTRTTDFTTTDSSASNLFASALSFTPKYATSILEVEFSSYQAEAWNDYGSSEVDGYVGIGMGLKSDATQIDLLSNGIKGRTAADGTIFLRFKPMLRAWVVAGSTSARSFQVTANSYTSGHTTTLSAGATYPMLLTVKEYKA